MQVPILEIAYRGVARTEALDTMVRDHCERLTRFAPHIESCRIAIERPNASPRAGSGYRVRLDITVPPKHEIVVKREAGDGNMHDDVALVVKEVFKAAERKLTQLKERQRGDVKQHQAQQMQGIITVKNEDHGFIRDLDGRQVYFHRNAVLAPGFRDVDVGSGVAFEEEMGAQGPQATTVRVVDRRGGHRRDRRIEEVPLQENRGYQKSKG